MSMFQVVSIDVDNSLIADQDLELTVLKEQVSNYLGYMVAKSGLARNEIACTITLDKARIAELLRAQDAEGIRIYLTKETDGDSIQTDVSLLALPVAKGSDGKLVEVLPSTNDSDADVHNIAQPLLVFRADCPTGACPPGSGTTRANLTLLS